MVISIQTIEHSIPELETGRLILRPFNLNDAPRVQQLAGVREIAATTGIIPHPYPDGEAERWISTHAQKWNDGSGVDFAIVRRTDNLLVGAIAWMLKREHLRAEVGYWIGHECWGHGYATEALKAVIAHAFSLGIHRIFAEHFAHNPASGRVMLKAGMTHEGTLRQHMIKWGEPVDCEVYGILATEWNSALSSR